MRRPVGATTSAGLVVDRYPADEPLSTIVFVHGVMDRSVGWKRVIRHLDRHEVLIADRRGYHRNRDIDWPQGRLHADIEDLCEIIELATTRPVVVVGHSQGALIALHALARMPRRAGDALVVWEPPMPWEEWYEGSWGSASLDREPAEAAEFFLRGVLGDALWERFDRASRDERRGEGRALLADLTASRSAEGRLRPGPLSVPVPVTIGSGGSSAPHNRRSADTLHEMIPSSTRVVVPGAGHGVQLDEPRGLALVIEQASLEARGS